MTKARVKSRVIDKGGKRFLVGGNLADGRRFEAGQPLPSDLSNAEYLVLDEMGAISSGDADEEEAE